MGNQESKDVAAHEAHREELSGAAAAAAGRETEQRNLARASATGGRWLEDDTTPKTAPSQRDQPEVVAVVAAVAAAHRLEAVQRAAAEAEAHTRPAAGGGEGRGNPLADTGLFPPGAALEAPQRSAHGMLMPYHLVHVHFWHCKKKLYLKMDRSVVWQTQVGPLVLPGLHRRWRPWTMTPSAAWKSCQPGTRCILREFAE